MRTKAQPGEATKVKEFKLSKRMEEIWRNIDQKLSDITDPHTETNLKEWKKGIKTVRNSLKVVLKLKQRQIDRIRITERIETRMLKFKDRKKDVIRSVMGKSRANIKVSHMIKQDVQEIITNLQEISKEVARYFQENWRERYFGKKKVRTSTQWLNKYLPIKPKGRNIYGS